MKVISARPMGLRPVFDLSVDHPDHSFILADYGLVAHNSAVIIADEPIRNFIPVTSVSGVQATSFTAPSVEAIGGIKFDFLGVSVLKDIQDAINLIQSRHMSAVPQAQMLNGRLVPAHRIVIGRDGVLSDIYDLPEEEEVFQDIIDRKTETIPQFSTSSAHKGLQNTKYKREDGRWCIDSVMEMAVFNALNRPGPLEYLVQDPEDPDKKHNIVVEYYRRARGLPPSQSIPAIIADLAPETHGLIIFQETLQRIYQSITGCSGGEAEEFRSDIGKKKKDKIDAAYKKFMERASEQIGSAQAQEVWDSLKTFARYGFNKSHAVAYALVAYACAWMKHHYPLEWWCAVLRNADKDVINTKHWTHCWQFVELPDIQLSGRYFEIQGDKIRAPLSLLHGVGEKAHELLSANAPYASVRDLASKLVKFRVENIQRVEKTRKNKKTKEPENVIVSELGRLPIHRGIIKKLIVSGCMDSLLPKDYSLGTALSEFDSAMHSAFDDQCAALGFKYKPGKKTDIIVIDPLTKYQIRKSILSVYGEDLRRLVKDIEFKFIDNTKVRPRYKSSSWNHRRRQMEDHSDPVVGVKTFLADQNSDYLPDGGYRYAIVAYIEEVRSFTYQKFKEAVSLTIEVGGAKVEIVQWPDKDGNLPEEAKSLRAGQIIYALVSKYSADKPFAIKETRLIREVLNDKDDSDS